MKKTFYILTLICSVFGTVKSQTNVYHQFPDSNAVWRVNYDDCQVWPYNLTKKFQYVLYGDTVINVINYKKIKRVGDCCLNIFPTGQIFTNNGYIGAFREDTINKKIYLMLKDSTNELLLYDFNLSVGDTLTGLYALQSNCSSPPFITVQSIDSIFVYNSYRKRINFFSPFSESFIEGIGSNKGLLEGFYFHADCCDRNTVCFKVNNNVIYPDTATSYSCDLAVASISENISDNFISIYPNPTTSNLTINCKSDISSIIYNLTGQIIIKSNKKVINLQQLPNGIYIIELTQNLKVKHYEKIVKY